MNKNTTTTEKSTIRKNSSRSCDQCRQRKVKCNEGNPCGNCINSSTAERCSYIIPDKRKSRAADAAHVLRMAKEQVARHATRIVRLKARVVKHGGVNTPSVPSSPTSVHTRLGDPLDDGTAADLPSAQPQPKTTTNCIGCAEMEGLWQYVAELKQEIFELRTQLDYLREEFDVLVWRGDIDEECELSCPHCYEQLPGRFALEEHVIMHGEDITELHKCSRCGQRFALYEDAQSHRFMCTFEREPLATSSTTNQSPLDVAGAATLHTPPIAIPFGRPGSSGSRSGRFPPPKRSRVDSTGSMRSIQSWHSAAMILPRIPANEAAVGASKSGASSASAQAGSVMTTGILADSRFRPLHRTTSLPGSRSASIAAFAPVVSRDDAAGGSTSSDSLPIPSATYLILNQVGSSSPATYPLISSQADMSDVYDPLGFDISSVAKVDEFSTKASNPTDLQTPATTPATLETILAYASLLGADQPLDIQVQSTEETAPGNWTRDLDVAVSTWFTAADDAVMSLEGCSDPDTAREGAVAFPSEDNTSLDWMSNVLQRS